MEFVIKKTGYIKRIIRGLFVYILLAMALFIYLYSKESGIDLFITVLIISVVLFIFIRIGHWYRFYVTKVLIENDDVFIEVYDRNKRKEYNLDIKGTDVQLSKTFSKASIYQLILKKNSKTIFCQYEIGEWDEEKILKLFECLKH